MGKPPRYPNSIKTVSERIPIRFAKQVRHFLAALDQLNKDFEVQCTVSLAGEPQPLRLIYTEAGAETQASAETPLPVATTAGVTDSPLSESEAPGDGEPTPSLDDGLSRVDATTVPRMDAAPQTGQNGLGTGDDWSHEPLEDSDYRLLATAAQQDNPPSDWSTVSAAHTSQQQTEWENVFTGDQPTAVITGRRPPTLTEILEGTYGGQGAPVQRTAVKAPGGLTLHTAESAPDELVATQPETRPTPPSVAVALPLGALTHGAETPTTIEPETEVPAMSTNPANAEWGKHDPQPDGTDRSSVEAPFFIEEGFAPVASVSDPVLPPVVGKTTDETWPTLGMMTLTRFKTRQAAVHPVTQPATADRQAETLPEPSTAALAASDRTADDAATEAATPCPPIESAVEPVEPALDAALSGPTHGVEVDDLQTKTADHSSESAEPLTTSPDLLPIGEAHNHPYPIPQPDLTPEPNPIPEGETAPSAVESLTTLDEVPSATEAQPASTSATGALTLATGGSEAEPLESALESDRTEVVTASAADVALELVVAPSAMGNEPAVTDTLLPVGDASLSDGDDGMVMATVSNQSNATVTQPQAEHLTSVTGEPEATLNGSAVDPLAQPPAPLSVSSETGDKGSDILLLATATGSALPPATNLNGSLETGFETASPVLESCAAQGEVLPPEALESPSDYSLQAVIQPYHSQSEGNPDPVLLPSESMSAPATAGEDATNETHPETVLHEEPVTGSGMESEPTYSNITRDLTPSPIPPTSTTVPVDEALTEGSHNEPLMATDEPLASEPVPDALTTSPSTPTNRPTPAAVEPSIKGAIEALADDQTGAPHAPEAESATVATPSLDTAEPPDQSFAEDLFVVWRRLALQQSPTVWGVVVSLEDIYAQGFSSWFAPRFMGSLATAEGRLVTWGCGAQLVNEPDYLQQPRERYQVGGKEVTGLTFQSPNARTSILDTGSTTPSLKPFAQSPALLTSFSAEPLETDRDRQTDSPLTDLEHATETHPNQWTETLSPVDLAQVPPATATVDEDDEPLPTNRPRKGWREGLRLLLGR